MRRFDWSTVGADILAVYETVADGAASVAADERATGLRARFGLARDRDASQPVRDRDASQPFGPVGD